MTTNPNIDVDIRHTCVYIRHMEETPMTNRQIIQANKKNIPFRVGDRVEHIIAEHNDGTKEIWWVSKAADRKEQTMTFADARSNEVSAYLYMFSKELGDMLHEAGAIPVINGVRIDRMERELSFTPFYADFMKLKAEIEELKSSLRELHDISGEANIPLTSVKGVRMMGKFLQARERAVKILAREEQP